MQSVGGAKWDLADAPIVCPLWFRAIVNTVNQAAVVREVREHFPPLSRWVESCYRRPNLLMFGEQEPTCHTGVQHGDPLGPLHSSPSPCSRR